MEIADEKQVSSLPSLITGFVLKVPTRARISIGGSQDRDTLIDQSPNYSNRTFSRYIIVGSAIEFIHICLHLKTCLYIQ